MAGGRERKERGGEGSKAKMRSHKGSYKMLIYGKFACQRGHTDSVEDRLKRARPKFERISGKLS